VSRRALGCGTVGAVAFVLIGLIGLWRAGAPAECPALLPYEPSAYRPAGAPLDEPRLEGVDEPLELAGRTSFGLANWEVWVEPNRVPPTADDPLPQRIVLACGDGTFQAYQRGSQ
jgi:hypothetical protein